MFRNFANFVGAVSEQTPEPVAKVGYFCTALAVSQGFALRNVLF
jgi:hypothetical protein